MITIGTKVYWYLNINGWHYTISAIVDKIDGDIIEGYQTISGNGYGKRFKKHKDKLKITKKQ